MAERWRSYTEAQRGEGVALAMQIGTKAASAQLGIPRRTLSSWLQRPTPEVQTAIEMTRTELIGVVHKGLGAAVLSLTAAVSHPDASKPENAHKTAQAADTLQRILALQTGGATARTANVNVNFDAEATAAAAAENEEAWENDESLRIWLDAMLDPDLPRKIEAASREELVAFILGAVHSEATADGG